MRFAIKPSRSIIKAVIALIAAVICFLTVLGAATLITSQSGGISGFMMLFTLPLVVAVIAAVVLPSRFTRGWLKVMLAKHFFAHRYDYRLEWLRFNDTLGHASGAPLAERVIKAIADITDAPAGLMLAVDQGGLTPQGGWNWDLSSVPLFLPCDGLAELLASERIIEIDPLRSADRDEDSDARALPVWLIQDDNAWVIVPLVHLDVLTGAVVISRPAVARTLDWEDFDVLRVAGRQAASYLAEEQGQEALSDAARFDEFNRRFAFIMHDIKNLNSQLALVARNAERHADNPAFRADMVATLNSSTAKMNDMLAKLSQHGSGRVEDSRPVVVGPVLNALAKQKRLQHPIIIAGDTGACAFADPVQLDMALQHLVQNAIDASQSAEPVTISVRSEPTIVVIDVADRGSGMAPDFIRNQLFRPFTSTKVNGFGIGAYEARALITAMGGTLTVESELERGSHFTITLPTAAQWHEALVA